MDQSCLSTNTFSNLSVMWKTVSEDCNLACNYCYYSTCGGKPGPTINRIDSAVLEKFIKEYMEASTGSVSFAWQGGEPLLAGLDFFEEVVSLQAKYAPPNTTISNSLQTNGTLIDKRWAQFFKKYNFLLGVSLDGPQEINDARRVTGSGKGSYKQVIRGIQHLRDEGVDFNILTVIHEGNVHLAKELMEFYEKENFTYVQFIPCMDFRAQEINKAGKFLITPQQYGEFLCTAFDVWYNNGNPNISIRFFDNILRSYLSLEPELCTHSKNCPTTLILEQNGDAFLCDFYINDEYKLGNVGIDSINDILGSPVYKSFLEKKPTLPEKCKSCKYLHMCHGGCPRNRKWLEVEDKVEVDYFCHSYYTFYEYAEERMKIIAKNTRARWMKDFISAGLKLPDRNQSCICGSGEKFKKCCLPLAQ